MQPPGGMARVRTDRSRLAAASRAGRSAAADQRQPAIPWRLTKLLARSSQIATYRARPADQSAGPGCYVVKTLAGGRNDDSLGRALLARTAAVASAVSHPHLGAVLSAHLTAPQPHVVMPYLEGATLRQIAGALKASRRWPAIGFVLATMRQVAAALVALHDAGWLHGQVRPEHIVISPQGHATLIDLSLARRLQSGECDARTWPADEATYAAPEALGLGQWTAASDAYSLGITLFEALTGQPPFAAASPRELAQLHRRHAPPPLRRFMPAASLELNELVRRLLAKEPLRRPTAAEALRWLAEIEIDALAAA